MSTFFVKLIRNIDIVLTAHSFYRPVPGFCSFTTKAHGCMAKSKILLTTRLRKSSSHFALNYIAGRAPMDYRADTLA
jgi:hypothetical protein